MREKIGDNLRDDTERGQDQDVDLGVTKDPEEVLPEQRVAAGRLGVEAGAEKRSNMSRMRETVMAGKARTIRIEMIRVAQEKIGTRIIVIARRAHIEDRDDEVEGAAIEATPRI